VNHAVTWAQGNAAARADELWQGVMGFDVDGLGVGGCVTKGLHHQV